MTLRTTERISMWFIRVRVTVMVLIALLTAFFAYSAMHMRFETRFDDLMPRKHPYIKVHHEFKQSFGGSNMVSIMLKVKDGDIFNFKVLGTIQHIQRDLQVVTGVNEFQIISLASQKLRDIESGTYGIETKPLMWPYLPKNQEEIENLKEKVLSNPLIYGTYVSKDIKAALISVDFIENGDLEFDTIFRQINEIVDRYRTEGIQISAVGEPVLQGLIHSYLPETLKLFVWSIGLVGLLLFVLFMRSLRGTFVPLLAAVVSAIWALGIANLLGLNFDPLGVVVAFLITARVISHSVQSVNRFDILVTDGAGSSMAAAQASLSHLFTPGILSVVTDVGGILVVAMAPIPMLQKIAIIGAIWVACISITGVIMTPVLLSWVRKPQHYLNPFDISPLIIRMLLYFARLATSRFRYVFFFGALLVVIVCGYIGRGITIGDANPGSSLLWQDSDYNIAISEINSRFLGTDRMFLPFRGYEKDTLKKTEVLSNIQRAQRYIELQPEIGGSISIADIIPGVKRVLYEDNPRFEEIGQNKDVNAELLYMFLAGTQPGDLQRFCDVNYTVAGINLYFRDHKGSTIRTALGRIKEFIKNNPMPDGKYELCGGLIGVLAAINEVIFSGQVASIALALLVVLVTSAIAYRSGTAGFYFILPIVLSNTITFAYMALKGIGLNINSLPVAALGIGLGVDYSIYIIDAIKEEYVYHGNLKDAIQHGLRNTGSGIVFTATPLVACAFFWYVFSPLRFQAEMAGLIAIWMFVSAISSLLVIPPIVYIFRPRFIVGDERLSA